MKILVTGGAGFIGSNLCERLVSDGHDVTSLDNYFTGRKENHIDRVKYFEGHTKNIASLFPTEKFDLIYHLGEYSRVRHALNEPEVVYDLNTHGTFHVLEFWKKLNSDGHICKLIYAGSSTKFADGVDGISLSPYTAAKYANTLQVQNYAKWYNLPFAITYFYNVYGPRELGNEYGTIVEIFKQNYLNNKPHQINAPGTQGRNFTHVYDTVEALVLIGLKGEGDEHGIAADEYVTLLELATLYGGDIIMHEQTKSSRNQSQIKNDKIKALGWQQKNKLKDYVSSIKNSQKKITNL
jgi:UDP-glucose 4-epimerase